MSLSHTLMLSCKKAAELVDKRSVMPLNIAQRVKLWMHLKACAGCRFFDLQGAQIDRSLGSRPSGQVIIDQDLLMNRIIESLGSSNDR